MLAAALLGAGAAKIKTWANETEAGDVAEARSRKLASSLELAAVVVYKYSG